MRICPDCAAVYGAEEQHCHVDGAALLDSGNDPLIGRTVGSYKLVRLLGEGGMGQVYLGVHPNIGSRVAIKVLDPAAAARKDLVDRFFAEAMAVNRIRHENIVNVLDLDQLELEGGITRPYIIMEHLEGRPLSSVLEHFGRLPQGTLCQLMREILGALAAAHDAGIIHRDLKPDNVFVSPQGRAKVLDFGIAKLLPNAALGDAGHATQTGMLLGTPSYMSPEQARGMQVTAATDLYAVGVMMFEGATGRLPFHGETLYDLLNKHVTEPPPPPRSIDPSIHPALEAAILRALAKDPAHRFRDAGEMGSALLAASQMFPGEAWASISITGDEPALVADPTPRPTPSGNAMALRADVPVHTPRHPAPVAPRRGLGIAVVIALLVAFGGAVAAVALLGGGSDDAPEKEPDIVASNTAEEPVTPVASPDDGEAKPASPTPPAPTPTPEKSPPTPVRDNTKKGKKDVETKTAPTPAPTPTPAPDDKKDKEPNLGPGVTVISTDKIAKKAGYKEFSVPAPGSNNFDAVAYLPTAQKLARQMMSDAKLTEFDVSGVKPNGRANLLKSYAEANFWFRSPSRSKGDPSLPKGAAGEDIICMVYVEVSGGKATVTAATREKCNDSFSRRPKCKPGQVWKKALKLGAPSGNWVAKMTWDKDWFFDIADGGKNGGDFTESIPDDC